MKSYINKIFSLKELALGQVAISLCQENDFKEVALQLEKPTYGSIIDSYPPPFMSCRDKMALNYGYPELTSKISSFNAAKPVRHWNELVHDECIRLTEGLPLPDRYKEKLHPWMNRIALEFLCYSRKIEMLFQVSRYLLMSILSSKHLKGDARLDEEKLALQLIEDERLTVLQRYLIACVYCLQFHVSQLWGGLAESEKIFVIGGGDCSLSENCCSLVSSWSLYVGGELPERQLWTEVVSNAIRSGNRSAVMVCWKHAQKPIEQQVIVEWAFEAFEKWQKSENTFIVRERLVHPLPPDWQSMYVVEDFNLPSYYSELMVFFLSQMDQELQLAFLQEAAQSGAYESIAECFLDWPYQDDFMPTITHLWGIIPEQDYERCLVALAKKYSENHFQANQDYDYRSLLWRLWEETPEEYKNYVFCSRNMFSSRFVDMFGHQTLLTQLIIRSPFQEEDQMLFQLILRDVPQETKRAMFLSLNNEVQFMCSHLILTENWSFFTWLLQECVSQEEIAGFKRKLISSNFVTKLCLNILEENGEKLVDDLLDWCFESNADALNARVINLCSSSAEEKTQLRLRFAEYSCVALLDGYTRSSSADHDVWEQMDRIVAWSFDAAEKKSKFKKYLFSCKRIDIHFELVFIRRAWEKAECFYKWFNLSPEEIKELNWDTIFTPKAIECIKSALRENIGTLCVLPLTLGWCLTDETMVINFKNEVEEKYVTGFAEKTNLEDLVRKLLHCFDKRRSSLETSREKGFVKDNERKRRSSVAVEDEPNRAKKGT